MTERLDHFMSRANAAYYATHDPFADFTTAPEISQVFGELLGAWATVVWHGLRRPDPVILAELGPGRGTLMTDARRLIARTAPDFAAALQLHFVDTSPRLRGLLAERHPDAILHRNAGELPDQPTILLANEFLDALPIRQFVRRGDVWRERHVDAARFVEHPADHSGLPPDVQDGTTIERCEPAEALIRDLATRAAAGHLVALMIDYGSEGGGDTLQALRQGAPSPPLEHPGTADLTAHVDFETLAGLATEAGAQTHGPLAQGIFLTRLGLYDRTRQLAARAPDLIEAANRLAQPERMGVLFKALAITPPDFPIPPGFDAPGTEQS